MNLSSKYAEIVTLIEKSKDVVDKIEKLQNVNDPNLNISASVEKEVNRVIPISDRLVEVAEEIREELNSFLTEPKENLDKEEPEVPETPEN